MPRYVEINRTQGLTAAERRALDEAFERRAGEFILRHHVSRRAVARALPIVERVRQKARLPLPEPPQPADWCIWRHKVSGLSYDALAADESPAIADLRRTRRSTR